MEASRQFVLTIMWAAVLLGGLLVSVSRAQTPADGDLRLQSGSAHKGVLEVHHNGEWGLVCDDHPRPELCFDHVNATVACTQLGYATGRVFPNEVAPHNISEQPVWLDEVNCDGTEERLEDCAHRGWGVSDCSRFEYTVIACTSVVGEDAIDYTENGTGAVATYIADGSPTWSLGGDDATSPPSMQSSAPRSSAALAPTSSGRKERYGSGW